MILISRADAIKKIQDAISQQRSKLDSWAAKRYFIDDTWAGFYGSLRNYELEERLEYIFQDNYIVNERCPFNGIHCRFGDLQKLENLWEI